MRKFFQETKILILFFVVFTIFTVFSYVDFRSEKVIAKSPQEILKSETLALDQVSSSSLRKPAGLEAPKSEILKVDLFCPGLLVAEVKKVKQPLVMLNLSACEGLKSSRHLWIKNETNGFKAQIFKAGEKFFRTDFIQLSVGVNKLLIEGVLKDGQKRVQSLEIRTGS